jgi:cytochrome b pre-mRNA-processing protein 3
MFYGRAAAYGQAVDQNDGAALASALWRNVRPDVEAWPEADQMADYTLAAWRHVAQTGADAFSSGTFRFERPDVLEQAK